MTKGKPAFLNLMTAAAAGMLLIVAPLGAADTDDGLTPGMKELIGKDATDFSLKTLDGTRVKLSDAKGSVVVLDMWATWCAPCVAALPHLDNLYKEQSPHGLKIFAVNEQEETEKVAKFVKKKGWSLPVLLDTDAVVAQLFKAESLPETVVIGKDGKIKKIFAGGGHEKELAAVVAEEMK